MYRNKSPTLLVAKYKCALITLLIPSALCAAVAFQSAGLASDSGWLSSLTAEFHAERVAVLKFPKIIQLNAVVGFYGH